MNNSLRLVIIVNLIALPVFFASSLQASKKKFAAQACALGLAEENQLVQQVLILFRDYCSYEKELIENSYMPENIKQEIANKLEQKKGEFNEIFTAQKNNTCFINKMIQLIKAFELHMLNEKIRTVEVLLEELNKK